MGGISTVWLYDMVILYIPLVPILSGTRRLSESTGSPSKASAEVMSGSLGTVAVCSFKITGRLKVFLMEELTGSSPRPFWSRIAHLQGSRCFRLNFLLDIADPQAGCLLLLLGYPGPGWVGLPLTVQFTAYRGIEGTVFFRSPTRKIQVLSKLNTFPIVICSFTGKTSTSSPDHRNNNYS